MAQLLVRNLDEAVKAKLQRRARENGRSTEAEAREILRDAVAGEAGPHRGLGSQIAARFAGLGMPVIEEQRGYPARPAAFDD